ncbi:MAG: hypothetical protein KDJ90_23375 [Nitratireductor sp.]|nr:hypothetical protein [Nitratireductor sp.]
MNPSLYQQIRGEGRRLLKMAGLVAAGVVLLVLASLFTDHPASFFFKVVSLAGTALLLFSVAMMIVTFRKARAVIPGALIVSLATTLVVLLVQLWLAPLRPGLASGAIAFAAGMVIGYGWSRTTLFYIDRETVLSRGTAWYLAVWAATFLFNQLLHIFANGAPATALAAMLVATGIAIGNIAGQLLRYRQAILMIAGAAPAQAVGGTS